MTRWGFWQGLFTREERMAVLFLAGITFLGWGLLGARRVGWYAPSPQIAQPLEIRINHASILELGALPGIGPRLAKRIVEDRKIHGRFLTLTDLNRVKGITPKALSKLKGFVRFD